MKNAVVVLGMHRSGTSSVAGLISLLDYSAGKDLIPGNDENPKGFFENKLILDFNESLIKKLKVNCYSTYYVPIDWYNKSFFAEEEKQLTGILRNQFSGVDKILLKDPRICNLLPLYLSVFARENIQVRFVIIHRQPEAVANSLFKRNQVSYHKSNLLWLDHIFKAEFYTRKQARAFITFDTVLSSPARALQSLCNDLDFYGKLPESILTRADSFIEKGLNHYQNRGILPNHNEENLCTILWNLLNTASQTQINLSDDDFDRLSARFYQNLASYHGLHNQYTVNLIGKNENNHSFSIQKKAQPGVNYLEFHFDNSQKITELNLSITPQPPAFVIEDAMVIKNSHESETLQWSDKATSLQLEAGKIFLESENPVLLKGSIREMSVVKIVLNITILSFEQAALQMLSVKNWAIEARYLQIDKQLILNSFSWKLGNFLCSPAKWLNRLFFPARQQKNLELYRIDG